MRGRGVTVWVKRAMRRKKSKGKGQTKRRVGFVLVLSCLPCSSFLFWGASASLSFAGGPCGTLLIYVHVKIGRGKLRSATRFYSLSSFQPLPHRSSLHPFPTNVD